MLKWLKLSLYSYVIKNLILCNQVRIFKPENVSELLKESLRDYVQASVGLNCKGKLMVPKLLQCFAKGIVEDSMLPEWICQFLYPEQAAMVRDCSSHQKWRLLGARGFSVLPFDSRFRYLFVMEDSLHAWKSMFLVNYWFSILQKSWEIRLYWKPKNFFQNTEYLLGLAVCCRSPLIYGVTAYWCSKRALCIGEGSINSRLQGNGRFNLDIRCWSYGTAVKMPTTKVYTMYYK